MCQLARLKVLVEPNKWFIYCTHICIYIYPKTRQGRLNCNRIISIIFHHCPLRMITFQEATGPQIQNSSNPKLELILDAGVIIPPPSQKQHEITGGRIIYSSYTIMSLLCFYISFLVQYVCIPIVKNWF